MERDKHGQRNGAEFVVVKDLAPKRVRGNKEYNSAKQTAKSLNQDKACLMSQQT
jgi:hypothetical protein